MVMSFLQGVFGKKFLNGGEFILDSVHCCILISCHGYIGFLIMRLRLVGEFR